MKGSYLGYFADVLHERHAHPYQNSLLVGDGYNLARTVPTWLNALASFPIDYVLAR